MTKTLDWTGCVRAGVVTDREADLLRDCVCTDGEGGWHIDTGGLDEANCQALERAIRWFCSVGGVQ
jgi:hypothetical protein